MKIEKIKSGDFIKKETTTYLVKDLIKLDNRKYLLDAFFAISNKKNAKLYTDIKIQFFQYEIEDRVKNATKIEIENLKNKIKEKYPNTENGYIKNEEKEKRIKTSIGLDISDDEKQIKELYANLPKYFKKKNKIYVLTIIRNEWDGNDNAWIAMYALENQKSTSRLSNSAKPLLKVEGTSLFDVLKKIELKYKHKNEDNY